MSLDRTVPIDIKPCVPDIAEFKKALTKTNHSGLMGRVFNKAEPGDFIKKMAKEFCAEMLECHFEDHDAHWQEFAMYFNANSPGFYESPFNEREGWNKAIKPYLPKGAKLQEVVAANVQRLMLHACQVIVDEHGVMRPWLDAFLGREEKADNSRLEQAIKLYGKNQVCVKLIGAVMLCFGSALPIPEQNLSLPNLAVLIMRILDQQVKLNGLLVDQYDLLQKSIHHGAPSETFKRIATTLCAQTVDSIQLMWLRPFCDYSAVTVWLRMANALHAMPRAASIYANGVDALEHMYKQFIFCEEDMAARTKILEWVSHITLALTKLNLLHYTLGIKRVSQSVHQIGQDVYQSASKLVDAVLVAREGHLYSLMQIIDGTANIMRGGKSAVPLQQLIKMAEGLPGQSNWLAKVVGATAVVAGSAIALLGQAAAPATAGAASAGGLYVGGGLVGVGTKLFYDERQRRLSNHLAQLAAEVKKEGEWKEPPEEYAVWLSEEDDNDAAIDLDDFRLKK